MRGVGAARRLIGPTTSIMPAPATPYAPYLLLQQYFAMRHAVTRVKLLSILVIATTDFL